MMNKSILIIKIKKYISDEAISKLKLKFESLLGDDFKIILVEDNFDFALISDKDKNILLSNIEEIDIKDIININIKMEE
jgi:hypothetical protein